MNYKSKKFTDLTSGRVMEVIDQFEDIAILSDKSKIKVNRLLDKNFFEEYIDPNSFFSNESLLNSFADKIRQISPDAIQRADNSPRETNLISENRMPNNDLNNLSGSTVVKPLFNDPAVIPYDPEEEKMELMRKAQSMYGNVSVDESLKRQNDVFRNIIDDNPNIPVVEPHRPRPDVRLDDPQPSSSEKVHRVEIDRDENGNVLASTIYRPGFSQPKKEDPIIQMFRNVKRNTKFSIDLKVENKIPRIDFIEMMEESYGTSIIDFLADEFTNNLLSDPSQIRSMIKSKIEGMVYPNGRGDEEEVEVPKKVRKPKSQSTETPPKTARRKSVPAVREEKITE